jgi:succinate-semialdehyde dehydrogenase/glutarate-semialdehyde dehydrogenase
MTIATVNPATGINEKTFSSYSTHQVETCLKRAHDAFQDVKAASFETRATWLRKVADVLRARKSKLAALMTTEMGKTLTSAEAEVEKCIWVCEYYAEHGAAFLSAEPIKTSATYSAVHYLPIGPVLAVMPWNFPLWQVFRFAAPTIMAGNVGLLKHASNVPQCALAIQEIWQAAGAPEGTFQTLLIRSDLVEKVINDPRVAAVTLTGSEPAGRAVAALAGENIKPSILELGGSDAFIVMPSANLELAVEKAVQGRTMNNGQSCIAAKRFIVHSDVYSEFRDGFAAKMDGLTVGDPMLDTTDIGPLAMQQIRDDLNAQVETSLSLGAKRITGAAPINGDGFFYRPGLIENIPETSPAYSEELFGPVGILFEVPELSAAIELANATRFGLGSAIFTTERNDMETAFAGIEAGATFVNTITASDPRLPFGGVKASGYGRELSKNGIHAFVNTKTCVIGEMS